MPNTPNTTLRLFPSAWNFGAAPIEVLELICQSTGFLGWGAFSAVLAIDDTHVLKISTCEASQVILPRLIGRPTPGLPLVFKDFGQVGHVEGMDGYYPDIPIHAYLMERLVLPATLKELRTDDCPRGDSMRAYSVNDAKGAYNWLAQNLNFGVHELVNSFSMEPEQGRHPLVSALTTFLGHTRFKPLIRAVNQMSHRVRSGEWVFDWIDRFDNNVLLSQWGEPILADPVYAPNQYYWKTAYPELYGGDSY